MASPQTRRQYRKSLAQDADIAIPLAFRYITSVEHLNNFVELATLNSKIGSCVDLMFIDIRGAAAFSVSQIRTALQLVPNAQDLMIFLPPPIPAGILVDIQFRTLDYFATNIPHASLPPFLSKQPSIGSLILGSCGRAKTCPLAMVTMPNLITLQCSINCIDALPYRQVSRLTLELPESGGCMPTVLREIAKPIHLRSITALTLDFFYNDNDILDAVIQVAPRVRKLKLVEKKGPMRRDNSGRRPWNDRSSWRRALSNLPLLEELSIVTLSQLVSGDLGQADEELRFVVWWTGAAHRSGGKSDPHPSLYHVMLRYGAHSSTTGALSHWYKRAGSWTRIVSTIGPAEMDE